MHEAEFAGDYERFAIVAKDGHEIVTDYWRPAETVVMRGTVQILHGLGEHTARYHRSAHSCISRGLAVAAHNHRGHGDFCTSESLGHYADADGWNKVIGDVLTVKSELAIRHPDAPLIVFGHSMGSYIAQASVMRDPNGVTALILSATTFPNRSQLRSARLLSRFESWRHGGRYKSELLNQLGFGKFNDRFEPARTNLDWLSRDNDEVDRYIEDPACGGPYSNRLWFDLTGGLLEISTASAMRRIPGNLPILVVGGEADPVGGKTGLTRLANAYRECGHSDVELMIYKDGRHEMLNETNREEVTHDLLAWIDKQL